MTLLAVGLTMMAVPPAAAQAPDPSSSAAFRRGPIAFTPSFTVPAVGIVTNVFNTTDDRKDDYIADVQPKIEFWLRAGRIRLDSRLQLNLVYYRTYESERSLNTDSSLRLDLALNRIMPYVKVSYLDTTERPTPEVNTRVEYQSAPLSGGAVVRLSAKSNIDFGMDHQPVRILDEATFQDASLKGALDRSTDVYRGTFSYAITVPTALTFSVFREETNFVFSPKRNSKSVRVLPGISFSPFTLITGSAEVGWLRFQPDDPIVRPFSGLAARVNLGYVLLGSTRLNVQASREVLPSIDLLSTYFVNNGLTLSIAHRFSDRWDAVATAGSQSLTPGATILIVTSVADVTDVIETYAASLGFYFNRGLRLGVRGELTRRFSSRPKTSFENLRVMSSFTYGFQ